MIKEGDKVKFIGKSEKHLEHLEELARALTETKNKFTVDKVTFFGVKQAILVKEVNIVFWSDELEVIRGEEQKMEKVEQELISYFNRANGKHFKYSEANIAKINQTVDVGNIEEVIKFKLFMNTRKYEDLFTCCDEFYMEKRQKETEKQEAQQTQSEQAQASLTILEQAIAKIFVEAKGELVRQELTDKIYEQAKAKIQEEYGTLHRKVEVEVQGNTVQLGDEILHEKFDTILKFVSQNEPVFLVGEAGTGKNFICKQVAKALGLDFYFSNAVTQEYKLTGFTDAMGKYQESQFYKAFKNGGLFMLDEMDASIPEVLVILNAAIANRYFDFPAPIGYVEAHPDFRVVAAGNTMGQGASYTYVGRNQLDGASLDRFALVNVDYDINIETRCANDDVELVNFVREVRRIAKKKKIQLIISYRCISRIAKMKDLIPLDEVLVSSLFKTLDKEEIYIILDNFRGSPYYRNLLQNIYDKMEDIK